jgi:WD40 repeat protein
MCCTSSTTVAGAANDGRVHVCDFNVGKEVMRLEGHARSVHSVVCDARYSYSSSASILFSGSRDKTIRVWDTRCPMCVGVLHGHEGSITSLELDGDWRLYSVSGYIRDAAGEVVGVDNTFRVWDVRKLAPLLQPDRGLPLWPTGETVQVFDEALHGEEATTQRVPHQSFTPDQFDSAAAEAMPEPVLSVHLASDGRLVSTHADTTLRLWDLADE